MTLHVISERQESNIITLHEWVVAREYYKHVDIDYKFVSALNTILLCGKGYTRMVDDKAILDKIRRVDRQKVMRIKNE